jgi:hypothetical protein
MPWQSVQLPYTMPSGEEPYSSSTTGSFIRGPTQMQGARHLARLQATQPSSVLKGPLAGIRHLARLQTTQPTSMLRGPMAGIRHLARIKAMTQSIGKGQII